MVLYTLILVLSTLLGYQSQVVLASITVIATNETYVDRMAAFGPRIAEPEGLTGYLMAPLSTDLRHGCEVMEAPSDEWIALVERGNCSFIEKIRYMQQSGAVAVVVGAGKQGQRIRIVVGLQCRTQLLSSIGTGDTSDVQIPSVFVAQRQYQALLQQSELFRHPMQVRMEKNDMLTWPLLDMLLVVVLSPAVMMLFIYTTWRMRQRQQRKEDLAPTDFVTKLPLRTFKAKQSDKATTDDSSDDDRHAECAICLEDYVDGDNLRVLPCKHEFHASCIDAWLTGHKKFCPVCKSDVCRKEANENTPLLSV
ncbi:hypothetical protein [Absidia glauca]|uniref:RING-type E3 ubiquitin transferase n=1 Tax=Absidia glauca TaxID=4829 RepID=A0A163LRM0_ABSGL|nr:hypothetical protein [Absidia glauca]